MEDSVVYLDNAASSWPKPPGVALAMKQCLDEYAANPGRGGHKMAIQASRTLFQTRRLLGKLFNIPNPNDIFFYMNTTGALNQAIKGLLQPGDHVITTSVEHNSVRRPLEFLKKSIGIEVTYMENSPEGEVDVSQLRLEMRDNTKLVVATHASNLLGTILPIQQIGEIVKEHGARFLVDAAQTAGIVPIDVRKMNVDMLAFPGHKGLLGPQGTGGLYVSPSVDLVPLMHGGTGSKSEEIDQPSTRPDRYESGTPNTVGIAGLGASVQTILDIGIEEIFKHEQALTKRMLDGLNDIPSLKVYGLPAGKDRVGVVAFNIDGLDASEAAFILDHHYNIAVRSGFHCTPLGHQTTGTELTGAVRASVGYATTEGHVDYFIRAIEEMAGSLTERSGEV